MAYPPRSATSAPNRPTVLVVEDELLVRLAIADHLRDHGFHVIEAPCADDAIDYLGKTDEIIDVLFSDIQMPGDADGLALVHWIRANRPNIAIIITSGDAAKIAAARLLVENDLVLPKPYDFESVLECVQRMRRTHG